MTAQLIDGATGCYIWSESVDATVGESFPAQERVAEAIAKRIEPELGDGGSGSAVAQPNENLAAHNLYLQGRYHLNQRTEEGLRKALDFFEKSLIEDAEYAPAHAGLSDAYGLLAHYGVFGPAEVWTKAAGERGRGGDARREFRRGAHLAGARQGDAGLGLGRRRARVPARDQPRSRAARPRTTGTRCRACRRSAGSTKRSTR